MDEEEARACELLVWSTPRVVLNSGVGFGISLGSDTVLHVSQSEGREGD